MTPPIRFITCFHFLLILFSRELGISRKLNNNHALVFFAHLLAHMHRTETILKTLNEHVLIYLLTEYIRSRRNTEYQEKRGLKAPQKGVQNRFVNLLDLSNFAYPHARLRYIQWMLNCHLVTLSVVRKEMKSAFMNA